MTNTDLPLAVKFRHFTYLITRWFGGIHPLPLFLIGFLVSDPIYMIWANLALLGLPSPGPQSLAGLIAGAILAPLLAIGMYCLARRRGLSHAGAIEFLHGTRYLNGKPVEFPRAPLKD
jgi:hypothetical protein